MMKAQLHIFTLKFQFIFLSNQVLGKIARPFRYGNSAVWPLPISEDSRYPQSNHNAFQHPALGSNFPSTSRTKLVPSVSILLQFLFNWYFANPEFYIIRTPLLGFLLNRKLKIFSLLKRFWALKKIFDSQSSFLFFKIRAERWKFLLVFSPLPGLAIPCLIKVFGIFSAGLLRTIISPLHSMYKYSGLLYMYLIKEKKSDFFKKYSVN